LEVAEILLGSEEIDIEARDEYDWTPLHCASLEGHLKLVRLLLHRKADVEAKSKHNKTPFHFAVKKGHEEVARLLNATKKDQFFPK
jgi:ankyrin repeat protein